MKVNWNVRFRNKVWLASFLSAIVIVVFTLLNIFGISPGFTEEKIMRVINAALVILSLLGVIIDPTTNGVKDSKRAMMYIDPWDDDEYGVNG